MQISAEGQQTNPGKNTPTCLLWMIDSGATFLPFTYYEQLNSGVTPEKTVGSI